MARKSGATQVTQWLLLLGGGYITYTLAVQGKFGADIQAAFMGLRGMLQGGAGKLSGGTPPPSQLKPCNTAFIPGVQYVENRNGTFYVVVGGQLKAVFTNQAEAEQAYNKLVCG